MTKLGEGSLPAPTAEAIEDDLYVGPECVAECASIDIAEKLSSLWNKAPLLIEAREVLELAQATIERLLVRHGPFSSAEGTISVIEDLLAKLDAE